MQKAKLSRIQIMNPVDVLAAAVNAAIRDRWRDIRDRDALEEAPPKALHVALAYLNRQEKRTIVLDDAAHLANRNATHPSRSQREDEGLSDAAAFTLVGIAIVVVCVVIACIIAYPRNALLVAAAVALLICLYKLLAPLAAMLSEVIERATSRFLGGHRARAIFSCIVMAAPLAVMLQTAVFWDIDLLILFMILILVGTIAISSAGASGFRFATAGAPLGWARFVNRDFIESERGALMAALSASRESVSAESREEEDEDVVASEGTPLPAPPGITEMVLDKGDAETFGAMREHLTSVRKYHRIVLWFLIVAFLTFFGISIYKFLSPSVSIGDYVKAFGSAGVGGAFFWFGTRVLWANRISQLSLALFESHVQEVQSCLREIPTGISPEERRAIRTDVWSVFRKGLNRIWLSERELFEGLETTRRETEPEDPDAPEQ
ncbi:MAG: hypothetical protein V1790_00935 [Planctomycetota bacterium]